VKFLQVLIVIFVGEELTVFGFVRGNMKKTLRTTGLEEDKLFYNEEDVRFSSPKTVETFFARNLLPAKPAKRFSKFC